MGNIDIVTKHYLEDSRIFADAFNYFIYDGKPVIQPEQLRRWTRWQPQRLTVKLLCRKHGIY